MSSDHKSASTEQEAAESVILALAAERLGVPLAPARVKLNRSDVEVDGVDPERQTFVEVFARQGALKGGQVRKVAQDILKLALLRRTHPNADLYLAFASPEAAQTLTGGKWLAEAAGEFGVDVLVVEVDEDLRRKLREAQERQVMVNPDA